MAVIVGVPWDWQIGTDGSGLKVQCFRWQAIKVQYFVRRGTWTLLSPSPRPRPRLCSRCSASDDRRSRCSAFVCRGTWLLLSPPPAPAQDYVQGAVLQMTGDQGSVLLCAEEHERFCPPRPFPRLCSRCSASDDRRSRCSAFVCTGTWTLLPPPAPSQVYVQGAVLQMTGDEGAVLLCAQEHERFCPPPAPAQEYVQGAVLQVTGDQGAVLLCAEEHEPFCPPPPLPKTMFKVQCFRWQAIKVQCFCVQRNMNAFAPPRPCPRLCSRCSASDDRRSRCSAFVCRGTWTLLSPPPPQPNPKWLSQVMI